MKNRCLSGLLAFTFMSTLTANTFAVNVMADDAPQAWGAVPSEAQMYYYHQGLSGFVHYGTNTYRNIEWGNDGKTQPSDMRVPKDLDTDQWVKTFKDAGFGRILYTAKHHDGFRNWNTSEFSTAQTESQIDVLEKLSASCTAQDMDMGLYLSPWDVYEDKGKQITTGQEGTYGNKNATPGVYPLDDAYNKLYEQHLKEIFENPKYGNNGEFVEFWMDGAKNADKPQTYDFQEWVKMSKALNGKGKKECINFQGGKYQEISWPGNESGGIDKNMWSKLRVNDMPEEGAESVKFSGPEGTKWTVWEADFSIRPGWFYHEREDNQVKSPEDLFDRYLTSVGHGGVMLLNIPPNQEGKFHETDIKNVTQFSNYLKETFGPNKNMARGSQVHASASADRGTSYKASMLIDDDYDTYWTMQDHERKSTIEIDLGSMQKFDIVELQEYIPLGQRISKYDIKVHTSNDTWEPFGDGTVIGYKQLIRGLPVNADKIRIEVESEYAVPILNNVGVYKLPKPLEMKNDALPNGLKVINDKDMTDGTPSTEYSDSAPNQNRSDAWYLKRPNIEGKRKYIENDVTYLAQKGYKDITFTGSKFYIRGAKETDPRWSTDMLVTIDNGDPIRVDASSKKSDDPRHPFAGNMNGMVLYTSPDLEHTKHTIHIEPQDKSDLSRALPIDAFLYCDDPKGMFEFEAVGEVEVDEGESIDIKVRRLGDASQDASIRIASYPGTAVHGEDFEQQNEVLKFAANETEKTLTFKTLDNYKVEGTQYFTVELEPLDQTPSSYNMSLQINIHDNDKEGDIKVPVTGITLDRSTYQLAPKQSLHLTATIEPENASNKTVNWNSDDNTVATVDQQGNVLAVNSGTATITATTADGSFSASCKVTVSQDENSGSGSDSNAPSRPSSGAHKPNASKPQVSETPTEPPVPEAPETSTSGIQMIPTVSGKPEAIAPYQDLKSHWAKDAAAWAVTNQLFQGISTTQFAPNTAMTRGMLVTVLHRLAGQPQQGENSFTDVAPTAYYKDAVAWASAHALVTGVGNGIFAPDSNVTREQLAVILYKFAGTPTVNTDLSAAFSDAANISTWAKAAMTWAVNENLLSGMTDGTLSPKGHATRGQVATILMRFEQKNQKATPDSSI